ncbi:MAG TPA: hypothetical protein PK431_09490 [Chitinophagales bacterium]|nr:hypothetical protein [Chitinophagales bacterium]
MQDVYILSGLGVDERVFKNIDFGKFNPIFIKWIEPATNESIESYAKRLLEQITTERPILIGLSFGGMMAIEIGKLINTDKIILLASAKTKHEIPNYYRLSGKMNLHNLLPSKVLKQNNIVTNWFFGTEQKSEKDLLTQILKDTDSKLLKWSIDKIVKWKNEIIPEKVIHIHGNKDKILPINFVRCNYVIKDAGHFMTMTHADEISTLLQKII